MMAEQFYNVCVNCWDKVKNSHAGARAWIHSQINKNVRVELF